MKLSHRDPLTVMYILGALVAAFAANLLGYVIPSTRFDVLVATVAFGVLLVLATAYLVLAKRRGILELDEDDVEDFVEEVA